MGMGVKSMLGEGKVSSRSGPGCNYPRGSL